MTNKFFKIEAFNGNGIHNTGASFSSPFGSFDEAVAAAGRAQARRREEGKALVSYEIYACERVVTLTPPEWSE